MLKDLRTGSSPEQQLHHQARRATLGDKQGCVGNRRSGGPQIHVKAKRTTWRNHHYSATYPIRKIDSSYAKFRVPMGGVTVDGGLVWVGVGVGCLQHMLCFYTARYRVGSRPTSKSKSKFSKPPTPQHSARNLDVGVRSRPTMG